MTYFDSEQHGKVVAVERLNNSANGNPRYEITLDWGVKCRTAADEGWVYGLNWDNLIGKNVKVLTRRPRKNLMILSIVEKA